MASCLADCSCQLEYVPQGASGIHSSDNVFDHVVEAVSKDDLSSFGELWPYQFPKPIFKHPLSDSFVRVLPVFKVVLQSTGMIFGESVPALHYVDSQIDATFFLSCLFGRVGDDSAQIELRRWCALRSLPAVAILDPSYYVGVNELEKRISETYLNYMPQGIISEAVESLSTLFQSLSTWFAGTDLAHAFADVKRYMLSALVRSKEGLVSLVVDGLVKNVKEQCTLDNMKLCVVWVFTHPIFIAFLKTCIRLLMGYTTLQVVVELAWDVHVFQAAKELGCLVLESIDWFDVDNWTANAALAPTYVIAVLFVAVCAVVQKYGLAGMQDPRAITMAIEKAGSLASAGDKLGFADVVRNFQNYVTGTDPTEVQQNKWTMLFPNTMKLASAHAAIVSNPSPSPSQVNDLRYYYHQHLLEAPKFGDDRQAITNYLRPACAWVVDRHKVGLPATRRQPCFFLFAGAPGLGKSMCVKKLCALLASQRIRSDHVEKDNRSVHDFVYNVNPTDKYCSSYMNQDIWQFDDWLQRQDQTSDPSVDIQYLFTNIGTQPMALNMAAVEDKGMIAACNVCVGATNLNFFDAKRKFSPNILQRYVASVNSWEAVRRRISHIIRPVPKHPYSHDVHNGRLIGPNGPVTCDNLVRIEDLFEFLIYDVSNSVLLSPSKNELWTWPELVRYAYNEYRLCYTFDPDKDHSMDDELESIFAQGKDDEEIIIEDIDPRNTERMATLKAFKRIAPPLLRPSVVYAADVDMPVVDCDCKARATFPAFTDFSKKCYCNGGVVKTSSCDVCIMYQHMWAEGCTFIIPDWDSTHIGTSFAALCASDNPTLFAGHRTPLKHFEDPVRLYDFLKETMATQAFQSNHVCVSCSESWVFGGIEFPASEPVIVCRAVLDQGYLLSEVVSSPITRTLIGISSVLLFSVAVWVTFRGVTKAFEGVGQLIGAAKKAFGSAEGVAIDEEGFMHCEAQARNATEVTVQGKKYMAVQRADGSYVLYDFDTWVSQGLESNKFVDHLRRKRFSDQMPVLSNNLWAVVCDNELTGNIFMVSETLGLCPRHVALYIERHQVYLRRDNVVFHIPVNVGGETSIRSFVLGEDLVAVEFFTTVIPKVRMQNARDVLGKFACLKDLPYAGSADFIYRDVQGVLHTSPCTFVTPPSTKVHTYSSNGVTYTHYGDTVRQTTHRGEVGHCGGVYLCHNGTGVECVLGTHVAGLFRFAKSLSLCVVFEHGHLNKMRQLSVAVGTNYAPENGPDSIGLGALTTAACAKSSYRPVYPTKGSKQYTMFEDLSGEDYRVAALGEINGVHPLINSVQKIELKRVPVSVVPGTHLIIEDLLALFADTGFRPRELMSFQDTVSTLSGLPHIKWRAAAGKPWDDIENTKAIFCEDGSLSADAVEFLQYCDDVLAPQDWDTRPIFDFEDLDCCCSGSLKDELRPAAKVAEAKTRLFTVCPIHEFILQRRYFLDFCKLMTCCNCAVGSALGLGPDDFDVIYDNMAKYDFVLTGDFQWFDLSFTSRIVKMVMRVIILWYGNGVGPTRFVDPDLPPLDRSNFIRYKLLKRLANFKLLVADDVIVPNVMHPSGSFLTTLINICCQLILWGLVYKKAPDHNPYWDFFIALLGDDSVVALKSEDVDRVPAERIIEIMADHGFVITSDQKDKPLSYTPFSPLKPGTFTDYKFLSRQFAMTRTGVVVGALCRERLLKMLTACDADKMIDNFPMQVLSFVQEVARWYKVNPRLDVVTDARNILSPISPDFLDIAILEVDSNPQYIMTTVLTFLQQNPTYCCTYPTKVSYKAQGKDDLDKTEFLDSGVVDDSFSCCNTHESAWLSSGMEAPETDTKIFGRPYLYSTSTWVKAQNAGSQLQDFDMPSAYFDNNFNAQAKLANHAALWCTACVKIVVATSPFSQGKLILSVRPNTVSYDVDNEYAASGDIHVIVDAGACNVATLKVPCVLPQGFSLVEYYAADNTRFNFCSFRLTVLSALNEIGIAGVNYSIFVWLEDVELSLPTITNFALSAQGLGDPTEIDDESKFIAQRLRSAPGDDRLANDPVTNVVRRIGAYVRTYGGVAIDSLALLQMGAFMAPLLMGLSRPEKFTEVGVMQSRAGWNTQLCVGSESSVMMATTSDTKVVQPDGVFGIMGDEMDINTYCQRTGLMTRFTWSAADVTATTKLCFYVTPGNMYSSSSTLYYASPVAYASLAFRFWRGDMVYDFMISKTAYQTGSLEIIYTAGLAEVSLSKNSQASICHRVIWDVAVNNTLRLVVPYNSPMKFNRNFWGNTISTTLPSYNSNHTNGALYVRVLNPLTAADGTVSSSCEVLVFQSGRNIEFADPGFPYVFTAQPNHASPAPIKPDILEYEPQGKGVFLDGPSDLVAAQTMFDASPSISMTRAMTVGEVIPNFRLLTRRFAVSREITGPVSPPGKIVWYVYSAASDGPLGTSMSGVSPDCLNVYLRYLAHTYAFVTGGMRYRFCVVWDYGTDASFNKTKEAIATLEFSQADANSVYRNGGAYYLAAQGENDVTLTTPYMACVPFVPVKSFLSSGYPINLRAILTYWYNSGSTSISPSVFMQCAGADDLSFGWQVAPQAVVTSAAFPVYETNYNNW